MSCKGRDARWEADRFQRAPCMIDVVCTIFFFFLHDIIAITLSWSEAFDLAGVGPYFGHPQPPYRSGDGPLFLYSFQIERACNLHNGPSLLLYLTLVHAGCERTAWHSLAKKQAPIFIIRNICVVIPCAVIALSTGNRISPFSTVFLLRRPHRISITAATTT